MLKSIDGFKGYSMNEVSAVFSHKSNKWLKPKIDRYGYKVYGLSIDGNMHTVTAHRLVAKTYIPNPDNLPCVNHKNENKLDNGIENLEWCTVKYNDNHGTRNERMADTKKTLPVIQILPNGLKRMFPCVKDASRATGINRCQISRVCRGLSNTAGKYEWRYLSERH